VELMGGGQVKHNLGRIIRVKKVYRGTGSVQSRSHISITLPLLNVENEILAGICFPYFLPEG